MQTQNYKNSKGFTLLELLVVIAIIGILASVVMLSLSSARARARDTKRFADMTQVAKGMELFFNDKLNYPTYAGTCTGAGCILDTILTPIVEPQYFGNLPNAPRPADSPCIDDLTGGPGSRGNGYYYQAPSDGSWYTITFCLGNNGPTGYAAGVHTLTPRGIQ